MASLAAHDASLAILTVTIAEIPSASPRFVAIRPDGRSVLLQRGPDAWRGRFAGRIFAFTEQAALVYGDLMDVAHRAGTAVSAPAGMIAAIALVNQRRLATRNSRDFSTLPVALINPWDAAAL